MKGSFAVRQEALARFTLEYRKAVLCDDPGVGVVMRYCPGSPMLLAPVAKFSKDGSCAEYIGSLKFKAMFVIEGHRHCWAYLIDENLGVPESMREAIRDSLEVDEANRARAFREGPVDLRGWEWRNFRTDRLKRYADVLKVMREEAERLGPRTSALPNLDEIERRCR